MSSIEEYFSGRRLYGDELGLKDIEEWYMKEESGYATLGFLDSETPFYAHKAIDEIAFWSRIGWPGRKAKVLSIGGAYGSEYLPIEDRLDSITIVEPGRKFWSSRIGNVDARYVMPRPSGDLDFLDGLFDLACCFSVLHHIPNVSKVLAEVARVVAPGGYVLVREPISSMGDWRVPRRGLTWNERGIPLDYMGVAAEKAGLVLQSRLLAHFAPFIKLCKLLGFEYPWNSMVATRLDIMLARAFSWNCGYHRVMLHQKIAPSVACWVFRRHQ